MQLICRTFLGICLEWVRISKYSAISNVGKTWEISKQLLQIGDVKAGGETLSAIDDTEKVASFLLMIMDTEGKVKTTFVLMYGC